ncbi:hypothetical protein ES708_32844 [subsurface metagenome]
MSRNTDTIITEDVTFSRTKYEEELRLYDKLLGVGIAVSHAAGGIKTSTRYIRSTQIFTRILVTAYTFFRLLPGNPITRDDEEHWDWPTIASVARNLIEAYLHFFYVGVENVSEEEVDFRLKAMWFHLNSEKYQLYKSGSNDIDLTEFEAYVEAYLRHHPQVHQGMTLMVRQLPPGPSGLPIEIYCFTNTTDWVRYEAIQADIFDHILAIVPEFDLKVFQEPTGGDFRRLCSERSSRRNLSPFRVSF